MSSQRLAKSAGIISAATLSSRMLGLVRDVVQGYFFATSAPADAFAVATRIPGLLRDLFAEGAMSAAFVPTIARYLQTGGKPAAWRLGSNVINGLLVVTGLLTVAGMVFTEPLVRFYASEYQATPGKFELTVALARLTMPFLLLIAVAAAMMGMLNALRKFFVPAMSPAVFNVAFILATVTLVPLFGRIGIEPVMALAVGMMAGGVAQIAAQWPLLRREGYRHAWTLDPRDPGLREVLMLMGPGAIGVAAAQINLLVNTWLATRVEGAASALQYAFRMMYMPTGIFGVAIATAAIPDLARHAASEAYADMRGTLSSGLRLMLVLSVPATVGLMVLSTPIVELIYQWGAFGPQDTAKVASSLLFYAPGIIGYSIVKLASPSFYSMRDARTPVIVALATIGINLLLNLSLYSVMSFQGLALGTAIAANLNAASLLYLLSRRLDGIDARRVGVSFAKIALASALMGLVTYFVEGWLHARFASPTLVARGIRVGGAIATGIGTLAAAAWILHIDEFRQAVARVRAKAGL
ncbi:MAG: murein biosynthesis integral membrane protein MurJ [Acidobacteria bacterium]|nr:murein biosynthesis integral membrane protein MurJ [Acidobacteriota bacterium]